MPDFFPDTLGEWLSAVGILVGWIIAASIGWQKVLDKINGLGERVSRVESKADVAEGRMDGFEKLIAEYRHDLKEAFGQMGRLEKAVDNLNDSIREGNIGLGSKLHEIETLFRDKDLRTQKRLVRLETLTDIEKKAGPLFKED